MKILQFRVHAGDPLSWAIKQMTWEDYTHSAVLVDEVTKEIVEAYFPHVRRRALLPSEYAGIDVYAIQDLTSTQEQGILTWLDAARTDKAEYNVGNLLRFVPLVRDALGQPVIPTQPNGSESCSQLVFSACEYGGGIKLLNTESYKVDPGHLTWSTRLVKVAPLQ